MCAVMWYQVRWKPPLCLTIALTMYILPRVYGACITLAAPFTYLDDPSTEGPRLPRRFSLRVLQSFACASIFNSDIYSLRLIQN